jgi:hypothetical protein
MNAKLYWFNPSKHQVHLYLKKSVPTLNKIQHVSMTTINWLTLFRETVAVYSENHKKHINTLCGQNRELLTVMAGGAYSYHWALKGLFYRQTGIDCLKIDENV